MTPSRPTTLAALARRTTALSTALVLLATAAGAQTAVTGKPARAQRATASPATTAPATNSAAASDVVLPEIVITAAPGTTTEGTGRWTTEWMRSATGLVLSQKETPQSTSVVTRGQMDDRAITTVAETMEAATGVTVQAFESDRINYYARGFQIDAYQYDGVPISRDGVWQFGDNNADMALYDHVEIVRGATGLMQGAGEPGASVNFIRKRPTDTRQMSAEVGLAYPRGGRIVADAAGPLNDTGTVRGRLVLAHDGRQGDLDGYHKTRDLAYGAVEVDLTENTLLSLGVTHQRTQGRNITWGGLPPFDSKGNLIDWPHGSSTGADWTRVNTARTEAFASVEHVFQNGWTGRLTYTHVKNDADLKLLYLWGVPDADTGLGMNASPARYDGGFRQNALNAQLNGDFDLGGRSHQFVIGAMQSRFKSSYDVFAVDPATVGSTGNFFDWDGSFPEPSFHRTGGKTASDIRQSGVYATLQMHTTDRLAILAGARASWWDGKTSDPWGAPRDHAYDGVVTPYLGFTYDVNDKITAYGSVASIFAPQIGYRDRDNEVLDPKTGTNYELGIKGDLFDKRLYAAAAVFETRQDDVARAAGTVIQPDGTPRTWYRPADGVRTRGFEVEMAGALNDRWDVSGGYTWRESKDAGGKTFQPDQPKHSLKLAATYKVSDAFRVGGAMRWQSATDSLNFGADAKNVHQESYALFDAQARYAIDDRHELALVVNNLLDKKYYATTGFYNTVVYGAGRSAELTLRAKF